MGRTEIEFAGIPFKNPLLLSAADHTHSLIQLKKHIDNGAGGIIPKTLCQYSYMLEQKPIVRYMVFDSARKPVQGKVGRDFTLMSRGTMMSEAAGWMDDLAEAQKYASKFDANIIGSLWGDVEWMADKAREMEQIGLKGVELDIGCPHLDGIRAHEKIDEHVGSFLVRCKGIEMIVKSCGIPVIVKMSADTGGEWPPIINHLREIGVSAVTVHNRFVGFMPDIETQRPFMDTWSGVGGAWVMPITCYRIFQVRNTDKNFPVIASNGAFDGEDIARFMLAGASLVQCASAPLLKGFDWVSSTLREFETYLDRKAINAADLVGKSSDAALTREQLFSIRKKASINHSVCTKCGICVERCPWEALLIVDSIVCIKSHEEGNDAGCLGCGMCTMLCPLKAISLTDMGV